MKNVDYGFKVYDEFKTVGPYILIEKAADDQHKVGDIFIPETTKYQNNKIGSGKIIEIGNKAKNETSLKVGDYVLYDYYSAHDNNGKNIVTHFENIIFQLTEDEVSKFLNSELL